MIRRGNYHRVSEHLEYLVDVHQVRPASAERYRFHLRYLLLWLDDQPLDNADRIRPTFPVFVSRSPGKDGAPALALESQKTILECARRFFRWAKQEHARELQDPPQSWVETLRVAPSASEAPREHSYVTEEEARRLMQVPIPRGDLALQRDRAAAALLFLSGARAAAFVTLPIQAVRLNENCIDQFPNLGVRTKKRKGGTTYLLQLPELLEVVREWDARIRCELAETSPWYAVVESSWGEQVLTDNAPGQNRAGTLDKRLRRLFALAGVPYQSAHKFRHGHAIYALLRAKTPADFKAVSMNLLHSSTHVTDSVYSFLAEGDVRERILGLAGNNGTTSAPGLDAMIRQSIREGLHREIETLAKTLAG